MNEPSSSSSPSSRNNGGRPRGGSRRRRPGNGGGGPSQYRAPDRGSSSTGGGSPDAKAEKPSLLKRVLAIFTGGAKTSAAPSRNSSPRGGDSGSAPNANRNGYGRVPVGDDDSGRSSARAPRERSSSDDRGSSSGAGRERPARRPESVEVTTPRLYVGNLSFDTTETDLTELFNGVGRVVSAEIVTHRQTQRSKGFAFVQMTGVDEAKRAVEQLHDKDFMGRKLFLSGAKSSEPHDGLDEPRFAS